MNYHSRVIAGRNADGHSVSNENQNLSKKILKEKK